jgi:glycosyltransferase involved in cell wall biosynthesis
MKTVLHLCPYSSVPALYGTSMRTYNLCLQTSHEYRVTVFAQKVQKQHMSWSLAPKIQQVSPTYLEYASQNMLATLEYGLMCTLLRGRPIWQSEILQVSAPRWLHEQLDKAAIVNVELPWQLPWVYRQVSGKKPIVLTAHNVEIDLYSPEKIRAPKPIARYLLDEMKRRERSAMQLASCIFTMSEDDVNRLVGHYDICPDKCVVVPNGVDCGAFTPVPEEVKNRRKQQLGLADKQVVAFSGAAFGPNNEAVQQILEWAKHWQNSTTHFLIIGGVGTAFGAVQLPNVTFTGRVDSVHDYFEAVDIAINPMMSGSGTNLKQVEYMAMGLPSITTAKGARGTGIVDGKHGYICDLAEFPGQIQRLLEDSSCWSEMGEVARSYAVQNFDWSTIAQRMIKVYQQLV